MMRHAMRSDENGVAHRTSHDVLPLDGEATQRAVIAVGHQGAGGRQPYDGTRPLHSILLTPRVARAQEIGPGYFGNNDFTPRKLKKS